MACSSPSGVACSAVIGTSCDSAASPRAATFFGSAAERKTGSTNANKKHRAPEHPHGRSPRSWLLERVRKIYHAVTEKLIKPDRMAPPTSELQAGGRHPSPDRLVSRQFRSNERIASHTTGRRARDLSGIRTRLVRGKLLKSWRLAATPGDCSTRYRTAAVESNRATRGDGKTWDASE
jgi:hypothetical protein